MTAVPGLAQQVPGAPGTADRDASRTDGSPSGFRAASVNGALTPRRQIECPEYAAVVRRMTKALARRVSAGDIEGLPHLVALNDHLEELTRAVVADLRDRHGYSWADVGRVLGTTRQAAQQRWGGARR